jgi:hypothetical protein
MDTGHMIYTGSGRQGGEPYVLFGDQVWHPALGCWVEMSSRYPTLLYIVQGASSYSVSVTPQVFN